MAEDVVIPIEVVLKGGLFDSIDFRWYIILLFYIHTYFYRRFLPKMQYGGCFVLQPRTVQYCRYGIYQVPQNVAVERCEISDG